MRCRSTVPLRGARVVAVSTLAVGALLPVPASAQLWRSIGPSPIADGDYAGRISAVAVSPSDPDLYFAAGADGGVWRTRDGGTTWEPITDEMPTTSIGALAIAPSDESILYAGTGEANYANHSRYGLGLYKSTDAGDSWSHLAEGVFGGRTFARIVVDPDDPDRLFAAIGRAGGFPELAAAKGHPDAEGPVGVFRSTDGGVSWAHLTNGVPPLEATDLTMSPADPDVLYAGIGRIFGSNANGIYKTTDGGDSWTKLGGGLPTGAFGRVSVQVAPSQPDRVYALITNASDAQGGGATTRGAYRTDDGGLSWTELGLGNIQATYGWYLSVVGVSSSDPDTVFMGGLTLQRSTNAGVSFSNATPPHVDLHAVAWDAAGRLLAGDDGGLHRSTNNGGSWSSLNEGLSTVQFYAGLSTHPSIGRVFYGGTQDNGSHRHTELSREWTQIFGGDGGWTQVDQRSPNRVFVESQGTGNIYRSTNSGQFFLFSGSGIGFGDRNAFLPPFLIDPNDSDRMWYGTQRVYRSTNGGSSWTAISGDLSDGGGAIRSLAVSPSNSDVLYAATNDGNVQVSATAGSTFQQILDDIPGWPRVTRELFVDPGDPMTLYLAVAFFGEDQVRRTRDGGQSWEVLDGDLPDVPVNTVAADVRGPTPVLYAGTDTGVYRSIDDGVTWQRFGDGLPNVPVIDLQLETTRNRILIGTQGRGAWLIPLE